MPERHTLYLIDGHAVAYRQYYAMTAPSFMTRKGEKTNATFGFTRTLLDILEHNAPYYLAVCFDKGLSGRDTLYDGYKATRQAMPADLSTQFERIYQVVQAFNIPILELPDSEADDVIGTIARQAEEKGIDVHIVSGDRDILQLLTPHVRVQLPSFKGDDVVYDIPKFQERYGLEPHQLVDLKALMGDASDNIPGVKGVGEKTATTLLQTYQTLDGIYQHLEEQKGSLKQKLVDGREMAYLSQTLATIRRDMPITLSLESCIAHDFNRETVDTLFGELEFRSLRDRLNKLTLTPSIKDAESPDPTPQFAYKTHIITQKSQLTELVGILDNASIIAFDTETTGVEPMRADIVGISLAVNETEGYYIPIGHLAEGAGTLFSMPVSEQLPIEHVIRAIQPAMTNPNIPKVAHNATFDLMMLQNYGLTVFPIAFDTMIAEWVRDPLSRFLGLKTFARQELQITMQEITELIGKGKQQESMATVSIQEVAPYAVADSVVTLKAMHYLQPRLEEASLKLLKDIELPLIPVIAAMERAGAKIDTRYLEDMNKQLQAQLNTLEERIFSLADGRRINLNSTKQLNALLFEQLSLPVKGLKKTRDGYSTDITTLEMLKEAHPIIPVLMEYRELVKLQSTYIKALPELINPKTGRIHTSFNQTGTSTGRFSSSNPNLQNIPIRTELGREVRRAFIAEHGNMLLSVDYSQIELRVMAHISGDKTLQKAFRDGLDIHKATASAVYGVPLEAVTYEQRSFAKRVNFGLIYGMGEFRLARDSDLTLPEARRFIEKYFEQMPNVKTYIENTKDLALKQGYVETLLGRKRYFKRLQSGALNGNEAQAELRAAINAPIQGTAADILKIAMIRLHQALKQHYPSTLITLQVHDELVLEVPEKDLSAVASLVIDIMQNAYPLDVPLVANAEYGKDWLEMQPIIAS